MEGPTGIVAQVARASDVNAFDVSEVLFIDNTNHFSHSWELARTISIPLIA